MSFFLAQMGNDTDHWAALSDGYRRIGQGINALEVSSFVNYSKQERMDSFTQNKPPSNAFRWN